MKFELQPYHRNVSQDVLLNDLQRVAKELGKPSVTMEEYREYGIYHPSTLQRRFGSWFDALARAGLKRTRNLGISDEEYFRNLEYLWRSLGRQPRHSDVRRPFSEYCAGAYEHRFGSWRKALEAFIGFVNAEGGDDTSFAQEHHVDTSSSERPETIETAVARQQSGCRSRRTPSWRTRFLVMRRDNFRCRLCGASPAVKPGVVLHIDHIMPWSEGGETKMTNLQTLCGRCNIGKSNLPLDAGSRS